VKGPSFGHCALGICATAALLAGCGGSQTPMSGAMPQTAAIAAHANRSKSWMLLEAKNKELLYVVYPNYGSQKGYVAAYSYPQGVLEGQISGLTAPVGDCTDAKGDLYITNENLSNSSVVEFAHGGSKPIRTLSVPGINSVSCAVNPTNGDLAVTDYGTQRGEGALVAVYPKAKGSPRLYSSSNVSSSHILNYAYCGYDNADDLFVDGNYTSGYQTALVAELPRGGNRLLTLQLNQGIGWLSGVQWDGKYLAVGQAVKPYIFRFKISGTTGTLVGSTPLTDATNAFQFVFAGKRVIVANYYFVDRYIYRWDVLIYRYPAGGNSTGQISSNDLPVLSVALSPVHAAR
jgi:hypothetical protein